MVVDDPPEEQLRALSLYVPCEPMVEPLSYAEAAALALKHENEADQVALARLLRSGWRREPPSARTSRTLPRADQGRLFG